MKQSFFSIIWGVLLCLTCLSSSWAEELRGKISKISAKTVHIDLEKNLLPQVGDKVTIFESIPGVGLIPLAGQWKIHSANNSQIVALGLGGSGVPRLGQEVSIDSPHPQTRGLSPSNDEKLYQQGMDYFKGRNRHSQNLEIAFKLFLQAAEQGHVKAQFKVGYCYYFGKYVAKDHRLAAEWFRKAAEQGYAAAQANLGSMYSHGDGVEKDAVQAFHWFQKAADQGYARGQNGLGHLYQTGKGVERDLALAFKWVRKAALKGNAEAQCNLALYYYSGWGIEKDLAEGTKWYRKSAEKGYVKAMRKMGTAYYWGHGTEVDYQQAHNWYRRAADKNDLPSYYGLGLIYGEGKGVARDPAAAHAWYLKAAKQGHADSQFQVGADYYNGDGVGIDHMEAYQWHKKSAAQGNSYAQFAMGIYFESGKGGVAKNQNVALEWYTKAARQGHPQAQAKLSELGHNIAEEASTPQEPVNIPPEAKNYLRQIQSYDGRTQQRGAKALYQSVYRSNSEVLQKVKELLLAGYSTQPHDGHHVDAMAWLCNILGSSGDPIYKAALIEVSRKSTSKKIRKYARKNERKLGG